MNMSQVTTHPTTDEISKNENGQKRKNMHSDVDNIEPAVECQTPISERKKKKKSKEATLKLNEHPRESQSREEDRCSLNDTPNKRRTESNEGADDNIQDLFKQPQGCTSPKDCLVTDTPASDKRKDKKRKEKKKRSETNQELIEVNMETAEGDKPHNQTSDDASAPPASLMSDTPVSKKRKDEKHKEKKKNTEPGNALNIENVQQSECEEPSLTLDTEIKKRKREKNDEDGKKNVENNDQNVEGSAPKPNLMFDTPRKKKKKKDKEKLNDENTEPGNALNIENVQQSECEERSLTLDTEIKKRKREKNDEDGKKNVENNDQNVEGSAPKPNLMLDTPRKKKKKKDKEKLNDENTEPMGGDKPQDQISDGGSTTTPVGLMLNMPISTKKDKKLKEKKRNSETGNALNSENLQRSEFEEPSLTLDAPQIKRKKKDKRSEDSKKNDKKKDSQDVDEEPSTDLTSSNVVGVTSDTPSQKRKDKVKKKTSESNQNLNDEILEHLPSQTRDLSPSPADMAMLHTPTPEKKEKCEGKKNQELNDDLESTEHDTPPAGETSDVTMLKKRKKDKKTKEKKTKMDKTSKEKKSISWSQFFSVREFLAKESGPRKRWMICEGFQVILRHQAEALLKLGVNPHFKDVLCQLWRMYLQISRQAYTNKPIRHSHLKRVMRSQDTDVTMDSSFVSSDDDRRTDMFTDTENENSGEETDDSECESVPSGSFDAAKYLSRSRRRAGSLLSMRKTLALCYLALVWCREVITLSELLRFVSEGHIPYVNAHDLFPVDMKPTGRDTLLFRATSIPLYKDVHKEAQTMAIFMALPRFPPVSSQCGLHPAMLSLRYLTHINLPDQLYEWVCWVMEKAGLSDESFNTLDPLNSPLPRYDLQSAAAIIITMKLLFGFNDRTEWVLSSKAGDKDKQHPEQKNFNLRRWYRLLQTALTRATHARKQFTARKQWTHKKALLKGNHDSVILKHRRVVEQLQASFEMVSGRAAGPQPSSPSSFIFRWGGEEDQGRSDGPSLHEQSLNCVWAQTRGGLKLSNTNYWHADLRDCKKTLSCKSHYTELKSSGVLPRSYVWLLELFSFLLNVRTATLHEEVKVLEGRIFKRRIRMKRSLKHRRWSHWWRTRGHLIKV